ncbi:hypothetical protein AI27_02155 [Sphingomonas sp. BHC-A]|nr:hypothetical protein AI27_02155 [Sphingomonas sp. BHC-A]
MQRAVVERVDAAFLRFGIPVDQQFHARLPRHAVAQVVHRPEFPGGVDMQQREGRGRGVEGLARQMQHHRRILAHAVEHDGLFGLRHDFPQDVDALRLQTFQMGQPFRIDHRSPPCFVAA